MFVDCPRCGAKARVFTLVRQQPSHEDASIVATLDCTSCGAVGEIRAWRRKAPERRTVTVVIENLPPPSESGGTLNA